ncbi:hypothetical protein LSH36_39g00099 [Paralvinella palmiformis]|uniref:F-box domain-containing protein n=1 Tax=Paralvinella palmiformis TaxID=53620 RepID=A0AAD9K8J2_9ANNE|nr:hypothetical protein LSH36_39g00099 [Paralvinella palmiformis]
MTLGSGKQTRASVNSRPMYSGQNGSCWVQNRLLDLPDDVIYVILSYCDLQSLGRLSQVCRRLAYLSSQDCVWLELRKRLTAVRSKEDRHKTRGSHKRLSVREHCRYAINWMQGHFKDLRLIHHGVKQLPWLQVNNHNLWVSYKNQIRCYKQQTNGFLHELPMKLLRGHRDDVGRFVVRDNMVVSGSR